MNLAARLLGENLAPLCVVDGTAFDEDFAVESFRLCDFEQRGVERSRVDPPEFVRHGTEECHGRCGPRALNLPAPKLNPPAPPVLGVELKDPGEPLVPSVNQKVREGAA
jgi:hypothetical protein